MHSPDRFSISARVKLTENDAADVEVKGLPTRAANILDVNDRDAFFLTHRNHNVDKK